ncbi:B-box type zinc finger protein ncl-1-like protein [Sarcoptes scabiei]|uniref:B-box type zinc finger protein ncl-1-like protein n=2 Tax=Sarcoptes scabiei TaxID=52283 RepID=A0A132AE60_SARSC|nr:B-box type zinc finger protein ncl-1-like protein [Sarcoptes scabiei]
MTTFDTTPALPSSATSAPTSLSDFTTELMMSNGRNASLINSSSNAPMSSSNSAVSSNSPSNLSNDDNSHTNSSSSLTNSNQFQDVTHLTRIFHECRTRLAVKQKNLEHLSNRLQNQHIKAQQDISQSYQILLNALEKGKNDLLKELEDVYNARLISLTIFTSKITEHLRKIEQMLYFIDQGQDFNQDYLNCKSFIDNKLQAILNIDLDSSFHSNELEFVTNYNTIQTLVKNNIGFIRTSSHDNKYLTNRSNYSTTNSSSLNGFDSPSDHHLIDRFNSFNLNNYSNRSLSSSISDSLNAFSYDKWSSVGGGNGGSLNNNNHHHHHNNNNNCLTSNSDSSPDSTLFTAWANVTNDGLNEINTDPIDLINEPSLSVTPVMPIKSQVQRQKMIYHCKFGEFGIMEGQFTEPSGVAVNAQNDIIVADTNNHRIQIFDKDGRFKFQFGECGKRDGQLLYPNRVAVVKQSGDIIVTERSPTHQIQVYNQYGQFVRKFGADILQHPRGVTVDNKGNIIIVECKVMRVIIFDLMGTVLYKFGCSKHLEFPNGVVVNDKQEIFISDNRAHCVKVFSYTGTFLRNIGGEGLTNYPIGVCFNDNGEILVADNHNNFNITIFTQDGTLVNALESKVKHSQCFDVALMDDNSVVLASKDYRIYIYRYLQLQSLATAVATSGIC